MLCDAVKNLARLDFREHRRASVLCDDRGVNAQASLHVFDYQHRRASMLCAEHRCSVQSIDALYKASMLAVRTALYFANLYLGN
jgi:hypothetical protein